MNRRHHYGRALVALGALLALVGPSSIAFAQTTTAIHTSSPKVLHAPFPSASPFEQLQVNLAGIAHPASSSVPIGISGLPSTGPQTFPGGGGYSYPPSSPYYVYQNYAGSNGVDVPYRQGTSSWGLIHVIDGHDTATAIVGATVEDGQWQLEQPSNPGGAWLYYAWFYNPQLPTYDAARYVTIKVIVNHTQIMQDGLSRGIINAYALNYAGMVPGWIANPNVLNCAFGGAGQAP